MDTSLQPRTAQDAVAQANRYARAKQLLQDGYTFTVEPSGMVAVCKPGTSAAAYWIGEHVDGTNGCDCADRSKTGRPCKHMMAWEMLQTERADELAGLEAQCAQYDTEEGWADGIPTPTPKTTTAQFLEALQARMVADLNKAEAAMRKQKSWEVTGHDHSHFNLRVALRVIGLYWGKELVGCLNLLPADKAEL